MHAATFNGVACAANSYDSFSAYEPGSGSTIMSYLSQCKEDDLSQCTFDPYYHSASYDQVMTYIGRETGSTCARLSSTGNKRPSVSAGNDSTIPKGTPFTLTAKGSDPDGDVLTYCWE